MKKMNFKIFTNLRLIFLMTFFFHLQGMCLATDSYIKWLAPENRNELNSKKIELLSKVLSIHLEDNYLKIEDKNRVRKKAEMEALVTTISCQKLSQTIVLLEKIYPKVVENLLNKRRNYRGNEYDIQILTRAEFNDIISEAGYSQLKAKDYDYWRNQSWMQIVDGNTRKNQQNARAEIKRRFELILRSALEGCFPSSPAISNEKHPGPAVTR
jgi:hypothetical protein